jgi:hypothetical protein
VPIQFYAPAILQLIDPIKLFSYLVVPPVISNTIY